jgi:hypothetical protein
MSSPPRVIVAIVGGAALAAGCRAPKPPSAGEIQPAPEYKALFEPMRMWTYQVRAAGPAADDGGDDPATAPPPAEMKCVTDKVKAFRGGLVSHLACTGAEDLLAIAGGNPVQGVWMADASGLWHVRAGAAPSLDNATLVLAARPRAGKVDLDALTLDDTSADVTRDGDAWCTTHRQRHADGELHYTLCFTEADGIKWGSFGADAVTTEERRFVQAR